MKIVLKSEHTIAIKATSKMKTISLLCIGKLSNKQLESVEQDYIKRFKSFKFKVYELKSHKENIELEAKEIQKKLLELSPTLSIYLTENGKKFDSPKFAVWINQKLEANSSIAFIIGGAAGLDRSLFKGSEQFSLSDLTFPHKIARVLFIEQLYRAETIISGHPYHK